MQILDGRPYMEPVLYQRPAVFHHSMSHYSLWYDLRRHSSPHLNQGITSVHESNSRGFGFRRLCTPKLSQLKATRRVFKSDESKFLIIEGKILFGLSDRPEYQWEMERDGFLYFGIRRYVRGCCDLSGGIRFQGIPLTASPHPFCLASDLHTKPVRWFLAKGKLLFFWVFEAP